MWTLLLGAAKFLLPVVIPGITQHLERKDAQKYSKIIADSKEFMALRETQQKQLADDNLYPLVRFGRSFMFGSVGFYVGFTFLLSTLPFLHTWWGWETAELPVDFKQIMGYVILFWTLQTGIDRFKR